jgi:hypothetical protein
MKKELVLAGKLGGIMKFFHIPLIPGSSSIFKINICSAKLKVFGDILSP